MLEVRQGALDSRVAPAAVLGGHAHDQRSDLVLDRWPPGTTPSTAVVVLGDEGPVPGQQRVRCHERGKLAQQPSAQYPGVYGEPTALVVGEAQAPGTDLFTQDAVLFPKIVDDVALLLVKPAGQSD